MSISFKFRSVQGWIALFAALVIHSGPLPAAPITSVDFRNMERPTFASFLSRLEEVTPLVLEVDGEAKELLNLSDGRFSTSLAIFFDAYEKFNAIKTIINVSNARDVESIASQFAGFSKWDEYSAALLQVRSRLEKTSGNLDLLTPSSVAAPSDLDQAVVLTQEANKAANATLQNITNAISSHSSNVPELVEIRDSAAEIEESARRLMLANNKIADIITSAGLTGPLYSNLLQLVGNSITLDALSNLASEVKTAAGNLVVRHNNNIKIMRDVQNAYLVALSRPMAQASYSFTASFPGSPPSRCGYTTSFAPNNFTVSGADALPTLIVGVFGLTLTALNPDFRDGCQGKIGVEVTRTITGIPDIGTDTQKSRATVDYFYSVQVAGQEDLYLFDLVKQLDFQGLVGESMPFLLTGSILSPLQITGVLPGDGPFAPTISEITPEELAALAPLLVSEPEILGLVFIGLVGIWLTRRNPSTRIRAAA